MSTTALGTILQSIIETDPSYSFDLVAQCMASEIGQRVVKHLDAPGSLSELVGGGLAFFAAKPLAGALYESTAAHRALELVLEVIRLAAPELFCNEKLEHAATLAVEETIQDLPHLLLSAQMRSLLGPRVAQGLVAAGLAAGGALGSEALYGYDMPKAR